jgi:DNA transformation protein
MSNSASFVEHALDLLSAVGFVRARPMFGGHGLYCDGVMFGLLDDDELFLKTDEESRPRFIEAGCRMWTYPGMAQTSYYRPPDDAHESTEAMLPWATLARDAALRGRAAKAAPRGPRRSEPKSMGDARKPRERRPKGPRRSR